MIIPVKIMVFAIVSLGLARVSRVSLRDTRNHGFFRFLAWETILILFLLNVDWWFADPLSFGQIISWVFLTVSLIFIYKGIQAFRRSGNIDLNRRGYALVGIEKTTKLVSTGIYRYIRHPFYSSLLLLGWGIFLKNLSWAGGVLTGAVSILIYITARKEESENIEYFGETYRTYMKRTYMFIPYIF